MKELNECQFSSYKKKQNLTRKQWVGQKEKKKKNERKLGAGEGRGVGQIDGCWDQQRKFRKRQPAEERGAPPRVVLGSAGRRFKVQILEGHPTS